MHRTLEEALTERQHAAGNPPDRVCAVALGVPESTYSRWKSGDMVPRDNKAEILAEYLEMEIDDVYSLLGRSRVTQPDPPLTRAEYDTLMERFDELLRRLDDVIAPPSSPDSRAADPALQSPSPPDSSGRAPRAR